MIDDNGIIALNCSFPYVANGPPRRPSCHGHGLQLLVRVQLYNGTCIDNHPFLPLCHGDIIRLMEILGRREMIGGQRRGGAQSIDGLMDGRRRFQCWYGGDVLGWDGILGESNAYFGRRWNRSFDLERERGGPCLIVVIGCIYDDSGVGRFEKLS